MRLKLIGSVIETYGKGCVMYHARGVAQRITQSLNSPTEKVNKKPQPRKPAIGGTGYGRAAPRSMIQHTPRYINIEKNKRDKKVIENIWNSKMIQQ